MAKKKLSELEELKIKQKVADKIYPKKRNVWIGTVLYILIGPIVLFSWLPLFSAGLFVVVLIILTIVIHMWEMKSLDNEEQNLLSELKIKALTGKEVDVKVEQIGTNKANLTLLFDNLPIKLVSRKEFKERGKNIGTLQYENDFEKWYKRNRRHSVRPGRLIFTFSKAL